MIYREEMAFQFDLEKFCEKMKIGGMSDADQNVRKQIPELAEQLREKMNLQTIVQTGHFQTGILEVDQCRLQIICLCYIGGESNQWIEELFRQEKYTEGYLVNAMEDEILFLAADQMNKKLQDHLEEKGEPLTKLYCPGEGEVEIEIQHTLLSCLEQETEFEVSINESGMLIPEKAMLWCFGADEKNQPGQGCHSCKMCQKLECPFRKM